MESGRGHIQPFTGEEPTDNMDLPRELLRLLGRNRDNDEEEDEEGEERRPLMEEEEESSDEILGSSEEEEAAGGDSFEASGS